MPVRARLVQGLERLASVASVAMWLVAAVAVAGVDVRETTVTELQRGFRDGRYTAVEVTQAYLDRMAIFEPNYNAFTWLNPEALATAAQLDEERRVKGPRGPLHGIPVVVKESIDVVGSPSTFGYRPLSGLPGTKALYPREDATVVKRLREAGAIILGKTNMPAFANDDARADSSWAGRTYNAVERSIAPGASSTGTATAISGNLAVFGLAEETGGSIQNPAAAQSLVGIKPTFGLVPSSGLVPLGGSTYDVIGPHARTVYDAALAMDVLAGPSAEDPKTSVAAGRLPPGGYTSLLSDTALQGKRIGLFGRSWRGVSLRGETLDLYDNVKTVLQQQGATLVDDPFADSGYSSVAGRVNARFEFPSTAYDLEKYLERLGLDDRPNSLQRLKELTGVDLADTGTYGYIISADPIANASYRNPDVVPDMSSFIRGRDELLGVFEKVMRNKNLDALIYPQWAAPMVSLLGTGQPLSTSVPDINRMGTPGVVVPAGQYSDGSPFSIMMLGTRFSEPQLLAYAYDFEQATQARIQNELFGGIAVLPRQSFAVDDLRVDGQLDGRGDRVQFARSLTAISIGESDESSASDYERRLVARFDLPPIPEGQHLASARLRVKADRVTGGVPVSLGIYHSVSDGRGTGEAGLFEDPSFIDAGVGWETETATGRFVELDVTAQVLSDYLSDVGAAGASFRLQLRNTYADDDVSYLLTLVGQGAAFSPELRLTLVPEGTTSSLALPAIVISGLFHRRRTAR